MGTKPGDLARELAKCTLPLTREVILGIRDSRMELVEIPEWQGDMYIRSLTAAERDAWEASIVSIDDQGNRQSNMANLRARLVVRTACLVDGSPLFMESDAEILGSKSAAAVDRAFAVAARLSGITDRDVKELEKYSGAGPSAGSSSSSPSPSDAP